jgi:hypothetical protein
MSPSIRDQEVDGREAHGLEGVDLLVDAHRAELGGVGRPRAPGHDDGRHHGAHVTGHADGHQVGHQELRANLAELDGAHVGQDDSHQEADERHDAERFGPGLLDRDHEVRTTELRAAGWEPGQGLARLTQEGDHLERVRGGARGRRAEAWEQRDGRSAAPRRSFRHRRGQFEELPHARRQSGEIRGQLPLPSGFQHLAHEDDEAAVPGVDAPGFEGEQPRVVPAPELLHDSRPRRHSILHAPVTREAQDDCPVRAHVKTPAPGSNAQVGVRASPHAGAPTAATNRSAETDIPAAASASSVPW